MRIGCVHMNAHYFDSHPKRIKFALIEVTSRGGLDVHPNRIANINVGVERKSHNRKPSRGNLYGASQQYASLVSRVSS